MPFSRRDSAFCEPPGVEKGKNKESQFGVNTKYTFMSFINIFYILSQLTHQ